ncbi:MAG: hypothetical protein U9Q33_11145 [Campylobacterota bacterium]|nr:hypothetical protein [Campylobacterota bacterium]
MSFIQDPYEQFLIDYLITKLENGTNTRQSLILYSEQITRKTKFKTNLELAIKQLESGKHTLEDVLFQNKLINKFQYGLLVNSVNTVQGLKLVNSLKKSDSNLIAKMIYPVFTPLSIIILSFYFLIKYLDTLQQEIATLKISNAAIVPFLDIPPYFNYTFAYSALAVSIAVTLILFFGYLYGIKYQTSFIYRIMNIQAYSDGRFLFRIINQMLKVGIPLHNIAQLLSKNYFQNGLRPFFASLATAISNNQSLSSVFEKYNFPVIITADIKLSEISEIKYEALTKSIYETCDTLYDKNIDYLTIQWNMFFWTLAFVIVVVVGSDIINLLLSTFTIKLFYT